MKVGRKELITALTKVKPALATQDFIPVMRCFCFTGSSVYAYNEVNAITVPIKTGFKGAVPDTLLSIISLYSSDEVSLEEAEGSLVVKGGSRTKTTLPIIPAEDFLYKRPRRWKTIAKIDTDLIKGLRVCLNNVGDNTLRPSLMGVTLTSERRGTFYSTDNMSITRYRLKQAIEELDQPLILPKFFCQQVVSWCPEGAIEIGLADGYAVASCDGVPYMVSHLLQGEPEDFKRVVANMYPDEKAAAENYSSFPDGFDAAVSRAMIVKQSDSMKDIRLTVEGDKLTVSAQSQYGKVRDVLTLQNEYTASLRISGAVLNNAMSFCDEVNFDPGSEALVMRNGIRTLHLMALVSEEE